MQLNILNKLKNIISFRTSSKEIQYKEAMDILKEHTNSVLLDVRSHQEFCEGHLPNAINIPIYDLAKNVGKNIKDKNTIIIAYCSSGARSKKALKILDNLCYTNAYAIKGGIEI